MNKIKIISIFTAICIIFCFYGCHKKSENAVAVDKMIANLGKIEINDAEQIDQIDKAISKLTEEEKNELKEKVVAINRVAKVVKGGRTFRFSAVVVVGDENGDVGVVNGNGAEVPDAIKKGIHEAKKNLVEVPIVETTVPHEYVGTFGSAKVMLKPAVIGTGVIAGGSVRPVLELAGYKNIRTKVIGTNNPRNVVYATLEGLKSMQTAEQVAKKRGKKVEEIL